MKKLLADSIITVCAIIFMTLVLSSLYVLDSQNLGAAIKKDLPPGTPKIKVIQFIQARKPLFWNDLGTHVKARISGLAGNFIYRKDIVLDCDFDLSGKLLSCTNKEYLTFY